MTITQDKRTGTYKGRVTAVDGTTKTVSTKARTKAEAKRILAQSRLAEIEEAAKAGKLQRQGIKSILGKQRVTVSDAVDAFLKALSNKGRSPVYIQQCGWALSAFVKQQKLRDTLISDVDADDTSAFINTTDSNAGLRWRTTQLAMLRSFFDFTIDNGWRLGNPGRLAAVKMENLTHAQKEKKERNPFTDREVKKLLSLTQPGEFWHSAIAIGRYTGYRLGDVVSMEWDSFSRPGRVIVWTQKRDKRVELPLTPEALVTAVASVPPPANIRERFMFPVEREMYLDPNRRANLSTYFRRLCEKAGIKGKSFHDLRSAFLSDAAARGVPLDYIAQMAGHSSIATTRGYIKPLED